MTLFTFLLGTLSLFAQEKLVVEYRFNYDFDISKITDKKKLDFYKSSNENTSYFELVTTKNESFFGKIDKIDNNQNTGTSIGLIGGPAGNFYNNLIDKYSLFSIDLNGMKLIVKDTIKALDWVLTKEKDKILGYDVKKAIYQKDKFMVEAWYSPKLDFRNGPNKYFGLPGIILKIVETSISNNGNHKQIYFATAVQINNEARLIKPTKGQLISQDEFYSIIDEMNKKIEESMNNKMDKKID